MMRIALFSGNYNYVKDGANQALNRLVGWAEDRGASVRVYSPTTDTPAFEPAGTLVSIPSVSLPGRGEFRLGLGLPPSIRWDLAAFRPDLVHVSAPDVSGTRAITWARRRGLPVVASLHTRFESYFRYYRLGWIEPAIRFHLQRFYDRCDVVLVPNAAIRTEMAQQMPIRKLRIWGRGVDRDLFDPGRRDIAWRRAQGWRDDDVVVLFFGRLVLEKGVDAFVQTGRALRALGLPVRFLVIGEGPARSAFAPLGDAVMTGHLVGEELARAVASADILFNPSVTEAFGNVVLEAMAAGVPVVTADVPSAASLLRDGEQGLLCAPGDRRAYLAALTRLATSPDQRRRLAAAALAASASFSWDAASAAAFSAYETALGRARVPSRDELRPGRRGVELR
jgi:glycosyltransferase involved in cell wall biosynthesis